MQQTETSKLSLIEKDDAFSPDALNFNAEKLSDILAVTDFGARAVRDVQQSLDQRVTALEAKKMVVGTYIGNAAQNYSAIFQTINLDFTPFAVIVFGLYAEMALPENPGYSVELTETGFRVHNSSNTGIHSNLSNQRYTYIAFG